MLKNGNPKWLKASKGAGPGESCPQVGGSDHQAPPRECPSASQMCRMDLPCSQVRNTADLHIELPKCVYIDMYVYIIYCSLYTIFIRNHVC